MTQATERVAAPRDYVGWGAKLGCSVASTARTMTEVDEREGFLRGALQTQIDLNSQGAELQRRTADLTRVTNVNGDLGLNMTLPDPGQGPDRLAIDAAVQAFLATVTAGEPDVGAFREALERISLASEDQRVDTFTQAVFDQITPVADLEGKVGDLADLMVILTDAQSEAADVARRLFGYATDLDAALDRQADRVQASGHAFRGVSQAVAATALELFQFRHDSEEIALGLVREAVAATNDILAAIAQMDLTGLSTAGSRAGAEFQRIWTDFVAGVRAYTPDVIGFRESLAQLANLNPENEALQALVERLRTLTDAAAGLQELAPGADVIKMMGGQAAASKPPLDAHADAVEKLKAAAAGGLDKKVIQDLYEIALVAADTGAQVLYVKDLLAHLSDGATVEPPTAKKVQPATSSGGGGGGGATASAFDQAMDAVERQIEALRIDAAVIGMTKDEAALFRIEMQLLAAAPEDGVVTDAEREAMAQRLADFKAGQVALADMAATAGGGWSEAKGYLESFVQSLVSGIGSGKGAVDSLLGSLGSLGSSFRSSGIKDIVAGGDAPRGGIIKSLIGGAIGLVVGIIRQRIQERRELEEARQAWADMSDELADLAAKLGGADSGSLAQAIADAKAELQPFYDAAKAAKASVADLDRMLDDFTRPVSTVFLARFPLMIAALEAGLGSDSPAIAAAGYVAAIGEALTGFVADTATAIAAVGGNHDAVRQAADAAQDYALSLLAAPQQPSDVETEMLRIAGTAAALGQVLVDLGTSADQAAAAIGAGVADVLDALRNDFTKDSCRQDQRRPGERLSQRGHRPGR